MINKGISFNVLEGFIVVPKTRFTNNFLKKAQWPSPWIHPKFDYADVIVGYSVLNYTSTKASKNNKEKWNSSFQREKTGQSAIMTKSGGL